MSRNKKIVAIVTLVLGFVLLTVGVSSALMNYNRIGSNQELVLGDIWMSYEETTALTIEDAVLGSDYSNYFEFQISGKNTYTKKDIYYDFSLVRGDLPEGKTEDNRIPDKYLKFKLVSVDSSNQETVIFTDETYESLENQRIYVETIKKNTENKINRKYRLYMTIDNSLEIGNLETAVFTLDEWESAFASVKLNVTGDFSEKKVLTYNDCFETNTLEDGTLEITDYDKSNSLCTSDVVIPSEIDGIKVTKIGEEAFRYKSITSVDIPNSVTEIGNSAFYHNYALTTVTFEENSVLKTINRNAFAQSSLASVDIPDSVTTIGEAAFYYNKLTSVDISNNITKIDENVFSYNLLTSVEIPESVISIGSFAFRDNLLTNIDIPDSVISIGEAAFNNNELPDSLAIVYARKDSNSDGVAEIDSTTIVSYGGLNKNPIIPNSVVTIGNSAFFDNSLTSVEIPNSVTTIGYYAFSSNELTNIDISDNIIEINEYAFAYNNLTSIVIPDKVTYIGRAAFGYNYLTEVTIGSSVNLIDSVAFATHGTSYAGSNMITRVINKSNNSFYWNDIFGLEATNGNNMFATGTYQFYYNGDQTIEIIAS